MQGDDITGGDPGQWEIRGVEGTDGSLQVLMPPLSRRETSAKPQCLLEPLSLPENGGCASN